MENCQAFEATRNLGENGGFKCVINVLIGLMMMCVNNVDEKKLNIFVKFYSVY